MFRNIASKAGLIGLTLVVGAAGLEACSSSDSGTTTATGGTTSHTGGSTSTTGGSTSTTGGSTSTTGGSTSVAGTNSGAGTTGTAGSGAGGAGAGPFACAGVMGNCDTWTTFPQSTMNSWGSGMFTGGITVFPTTFVRDATGTDAIHVTGMVTGYGFGFGLYFSACSDLSKYTGVSFKVKAGNATTTGIILQLQTNADYPWEGKAMQDNKGACVPTDVTMPFSSCQVPAKSETVTTTESTVTVAWADLAGGMPVATVDPKQIIGIQWALPWMPPATAYAADITVSDVTLTGGTGVSCAMAAGGTGAGGAGGSGGTGGAATGGGGAGGAAAGSGGTGGA
jgi:hypothetical protein